MKKVQAPPAARRLIDGLRDLGYDFETAIADLVDNSLEADATEVDIDIVPRTGDTPAHVIIADNGDGIARDMLVDVMRFGAAEEHSPEDLGKYGLGLKTASLSQANILTVASRAESGGRRGRQHIARWDLNQLNVSWDLQLLDNGDLNDWEAQAIAARVAETKGTVVLWSDLNRSLLLDVGSERKREDARADLLKLVGRHLQMVFHRFIDHTIPRRRKVTIRVGGAELPASDPFCRSEKTKELKVEEFKIQLSDDRVGKLIMSPYILPTEKEFSSTTAHANAAWGNWNARQGFYYYRNNRLIQMGGWSHLRAPDEHTKLLRIAIDFGGELDKAVGINVSKMRAKIPTEIREQVRNTVSSLAKAARARYDNEPASGTGAGPADRPASQNRKAAKKQTVPTRKSFGGVTAISSAEAEECQVSVTGARLTVVAPNDSPILRSDDLDAFATLLVELLSAVAEKRIRPDKLPIKSLRRQLKEYV